MTAESDQQRELFLAALQVPAGGRDAFLREACAGADDLRERVRLLIQAHEELGSIAPSAEAESGPTRDLAAAAEQPGTVIGPYKLLEQIGEGGMGVVWMAEQTEPVKRKVALKVIKPGLDSRQVIARFEAERQALAMMDHVNIARVFDGGTTEPISDFRLQNADLKSEISNLQSAIGSGRPYFVMELVHGVPITKYCDDNHLTPRERLELFVPVCQAIQHAHQKGIIHRDIKPSNVMVTEPDSPLPSGGEGRVRGIPKVIDFGVAKACRPAEQKLTERTLFTQYGTMVGTLEYMSPEQAEPSALGADTRSDIYSLGVLLYELLTGSTPLTHKRLKEAAYAEILRMIREEEPPKPSTRLSELSRPHAPREESVTRSATSTLASIAAQRNMEPAKLTKLVRGELDWIVMKCLEKDRNRRYETANSFAQDVQRYLADEPVLACPPSMGYRLRKLVRRNRGLVLAASLVILALVGGIIGTTWGMIRAEHARQDAVSAQLAEAERAKGERQAKEDAQKRLAQIEKGTEILAAVIQDLDPTAEETEGVTLRVLLGRRLGEAAQQLEGEAVGDPLVVARLQHLLGISLHELGHREQAETALVKACRTRERMLGAGHLDTAAAKHSLATLYRDQGKYAQAEMLFKEVLALRTAKLGADHVDTLISQHYLALLYHSQEKLALAERLLKEVLAIRIAKLGADHLDTLTSQHRLALVYRSQGKYDAAEALFKEVLAIRTGKLGADHLDTVATKSNLATVYGAQEKHDLAEALLKEVLGIRTAKLGAEHPDTLTTQYHLAHVCWSLRKLDLAISLLKQTLKLRKAKLGPDHPVTLATQVDLSACCCDAGRFAEAIVLLEEVRQKNIREKPDLLKQVGSALLTAYARTGKTTEATALALEQVRAARQEFSTDRPRLAAALASAGRALLQAKAYAAAEPLLRESLSLGEEQVPVSWATHHVRSLLGGALLGQQKYADAEPFLVQGYAGLKERAAEIPKEEQGCLTTALERVVGLYEAWGKQDEAARWRKELEQHRPQR